MTLLSDAGEGPVLDWVVVNVAATGLSEGRATAGAAAGRLPPDLASRTRLVSLASGLSMRELGRSSAAADAERSRLAVLFSRSL